MHPEQSQCWNTSLHWAKWKRYHPWCNDTIRNTIDYWCICVIHDLCSGIHCVLEQFLLSSLFRLSLPVSSCHSNTLDSLLYTTDIQNYTMCREDTTLTQAMHEMRGYGDIKLVLCIPLMLSESVSQQEKLSLEGCNSSGLLMIPRNKLAEIPTVFECSNIFLVASFTCVPKVL